MRNFLFSVYVLIISVQLSAQTFQQGNTVVNVGTGFALYEVYSYQKNSTAYSNDTAGSFVFPVKVEYGVLDWLGAAFRFNFSNYIEGDSSNTVDINGIDLGLQANYHFLRKERCDLYVGGIASWSRIKYHENTLANTQVKGGGSVFGMELGSRFYFGETRKIGIYLSYGYVRNYYPNLVATDSSGNTANYYLSAIGHQLGIGLTLKP